MAARLALTLLAVAAVAAGVVLARRHPVQAPPPAMADDDDNTEPAAVPPVQAGTLPPATVSALSAPVALKPRPIKPRAAAALGSTGATSTRPPSPFMDDVSDEDRPAAFENRFRHERVDVVWARKTRDALERGFEAMKDPDVGIQSVKCKQTVCRIEATFSSATERREFLGRAFLHGQESVMQVQGLNMPMYAPAPTLDGEQLHSVVYLIRE